MTREKFDGLATGYDRHRPRYPVSLFHEVATRTAGSATRLLDVGAGTGIALESALQVWGPNCEATAVDVSSDMVEVGRRKFPGVNWAVGDAESFLERRGPYDVIIAAQSYQWLDRPRFLRAARLALARGGSLCIIQNNRDYARSAFLDAYEDLLEEMSPGYRRDYRAIDVAAEVSDEFGRDAVRVSVSDWRQEMTVDDFVGLSLSSTQAQRAIKAHGEPAYVARLRAILARHRDGDRVVVNYRTELCEGRRGT